MFAQLYTEILPLVGEFFGRICGIATYRVDALISNIALSFEAYNNSGVLNDVLYTYGNFFTGQGFDFGSYTATLLPAELWTVPVLSIILYNGIVYVFSILTFVTPSAPLWIALPVGFATWGFIVSFVKFFVGLVSSSMRN